MDPITVFGVAALTFVIRLGVALRVIGVAYFAVVFTRAPWLVRVLNPVFSRVLGAGLPGGPNALIGVRGRKSGVIRSFPASVMELGDRRYLQAAFGDVRHVRTSLCSPGAQREILAKWSNSRAAHGAPQAAYSRRPSRTGARNGGIRRDQPE